MCRICVDYTLGKMTTNEAYKAIMEITVSDLTPEQDAHLSKVVEKVVRDLVAQSET
jgi:hypothetical protein